MTTHDPSGAAPNAEPDQPADSTPHEQPAPEAATDIAERLDEEEWAQHDPAAPDPEV